ncbi:MAG: hypothetical protein HRT93_11515 [Piscirickettsiaceae bacterium]|nr:hypothetical protein [Piscirickettsiaceae bacterium]
MYIQKDDLICGFRAIELRDFFKKYGDNCSNMAAQHFSDYFSISKEEGEKILKNLLSESYLAEENTHNDIIYYQLDIKGNALVNTRFTKRMHRAKVEQLLSEVISRASYINESKDVFLKRISKLYLFGSCLDESKDDYGDIDLIVEVEDNKEQEQDSIKEEYRIVTPFQKTYNLSWTLSEEEKINKFLKASNGYISIHEPVEFGLIDDFLEIYPTRNDVKENDKAIEKGLKAITKRVRRNKREELGSIYVDTITSGDEKRFSFHYNFPDNFHEELSCALYEDIEEEFPIMNNATSHLKIFKKVLQIEKEEVLKKKMKEAAKAIKSKAIREEMLNYIFEDIEEAKIN